MKCNIDTSEGVIHPLPQTIASLRENNGKNNALAVGFNGNIIHNPAIIMIGIESIRYYHHMIKENSCFVLNFPLKSFAKEYGIIGTKSARDVDKFELLNLNWDGQKVNAPVLTDCPVNFECTVIDSFCSGSNEIFLGKVEAVHVDEEFVQNDSILWNKLDLIKF